MDESVSHAIAVLKNCSQKSTSLTKSESCDEYLSIDNRNELNEMFQNLGISNRSMSEKRSTEGRARSVYQAHEEELKLEYYRSNPLRNYASTRGQRVLPQLPTDRNVNVGLPLLGPHQPKKYLPAIYSELRETTNLVEDRELHKKRLKTILKLNMNGAEHQKNLIDKLENSRKIYTEFSRLNKPKPLDCSRIESVLKGNARSNVYTGSNASHTRHRSYHFGAMTAHSTPGLIQGRTESVNQHARTPMSLNAQNQFEKRSTLSNNNKDFISEETDSNRLLIDAQQLSIKDLGELSEEFRIRKMKLAKLELLNSNLHNYKTANDPNPSLTSMAQTIEAESAAASKQQTRPTTKRGTALRNPHKKPAPLRRPKRTSFENDPDLDYFDPKVNFLNLAITSLVPSNIQAQQNSAENEEETASYAYNPPSIDKEQFINNLIDLNLQNTVLQTRVMSPKSKYKLRIKHAREKILNENNEKENLNKMTILQPFEETKLVINIDKVPSKLLNNLLNKQSTAPRYIIPPARAFGYFKKVMAPNDHLASAQPPLNLNTNLNIVTNTLNNRSRSGKHHQQMHQQQPQTPERPKSAKKSDVMGYESLKSLSEAQSVLLFDKSELLSKSDKFNQPKNENTGESSSIVVITS